MNVQTCFESGLLKRIPVEPERVQSALDLGRHYLERAQGNMKMQYHDVAFLMAYNAMLQAAKAALFHAGVKERSHVCAVAYLRTLFETEPEGPDLVELLDTYRLQRHRTQYDGETLSQEEAEMIIEDAQHFLDFVEAKTERRKQK
ncbi:HEPN domain-containing protein [Candidatus Micrarchaeota archaeon]|nr:HEPN domain-containing protein [Candidatus Micrarchaeota archaeon]